MLAGGCLCGATRYEVTGAPYHQTNCHCSMCRHAAGAPFVTWFSVERTGFRWTGVAPVIYRSSDHVTRTFCGTCGTTLTFEDDAEGHELDISTCSLDDPTALPPRDETQTSTRLPWVAPQPGLRSFEERREGEG